ncbi:MAG: hypothetical protein NG784_15190, partial [Candidatus Jettenia sp.]|nr:hypothetical protein [Candidatus Jettenia sp.]
MKYLFTLLVITLAPNFYYKIASTGEIAEHAPTKPLLEEKGAESNEEMPKQSAGQGVAGEQVEAGSSMANLADVNSFNQS